MDKEKDLIESLISPPGDTLKEHLDFIEMKPNELAKRLNLPQEKVHDLICGTEPISAEIATKLDKMLHIPSSFWRNREKEYRQELFNNGVDI